MCWCGSSLLQSGSVIKGCTCQGVSILVQTISVCLMGASGPDSWRVHIVPPHAQCRLFPQGGFHRFDLMSVKTHPLLVHTLGGRDLLATQRPVLLKVMYCATPYKWTGCDMSLLQTRHSHTHSYCGGRCGLHGPA